VQGWLLLPADAGRLRASIYQTGRIIREIPDTSGGCWLEVRISERELAALYRREGMEFELHANHEPVQVAGAAQAP
jgi:hypothetical protein